jgi:predicted O-methyltransferase YrrM
MLQRLLPKRVYQAVNLRLEKRDLARLERRPCDLGALRSDVPAFSSLPKEEWEQVQRAVAPFELGERSAAVNLGDRRAIYQLARKLNATSVLEVGTHIGASTTMLALALKNSGKPVRMVTVDILDVNDANRGPWKRYGCQHPPNQLVRELGCDFVEFISSPSIPYLQRCTERFDLIFLDGGHEAATVYQEVPLALKLLNAGGLILLHDFYPEGEPLWSNGGVVPGPWFAIQRFRDEGVGMKAKPLGSLPWPTKLNSNVTSLACLVKD